MRASLTVRRVANRVRIAVLTAVGSAVLMAPTAHADQASFMTDVQNEGGFSQVSPVIIAATGRSACDYLTQQNGRFASTYAQAVARDVGVSLADADKLVDLANRDLCPNAAATPSGATPGSVDSSSQYVRTESGLVRCSISGDRVACEASGPGSTGFAQAPIEMQESECRGAPCPGGIHSDIAAVTTGGAFTWQDGNIGGNGEPWAQTDTTLSYGQTYSFHDWTVAPSSDGTRFTNGASGHGMFVSTGNVSSF
jgi:hypothetical protein